jgi:hypothetical protein
VSSRSYIRGYRRGFRQGYQQRVNRNAYRSVSRGRYMPYGRRSRGVSVVRVRYY